MKRAIVYLGMILMSQNLFSQEGEEKEEQLQMEEPKQEVSNKLSNFTISGYTANTGKAVMLIEIPIKRP